MPRPFRSQPSRSCVKRTIVGWNLHMPFQSKRLAIWKNYLNFANGNAKNSKTRFVRIDSTCQVGWNTLRGKKASLNSIERDQYLNAQWMLMVETSLFGCDTPRWKWRIEILITRETCLIVPSLCFLASTSFGTSTPTWKRCWVMSPRLVECLNAGCSGSLRRMRGMLISRWRSGTRKSSELVLSMAALWAFTQSRRTGSSGPDLKKSRMI